MLDDPQARVFDRALRLRDAGDLAGALALLQQLISTPSSTDLRLHALAQVQLGNVLAALDHHTEAIKAYRAATDTLPRNELASLALFHALERTGEHVEALCEAFRLLTLRDSPGYRELFGGETTREETDEAHELVEQIRVLLGAHRDVQRRRAQPMPGDTVRVRAGSLRPGSIAVMRGVNGQTAHLVFTDGERAEVELALVDHHDI
jgi:tetratricopeptide (TPR) repeat protein